MSNIDFISLGIEKIERIYHELESDDFFKINSDEIRFIKYKDFLNLYSELITHFDLKTAIKNEESNVYFKIEPKIYALFSFIRNLLTHFPIYNTWDNVLFNKNLINWNSCGKSIDKFLTQNQNIQLIVVKNRDKEFRIAVDLMSIGYDENRDIYLKSIIPERDAVLLFLTIIREIVYILKVKPKI